MAYENESHQSEFESPTYSVVDMRFVGREVIRTVIMDGELMEFVVSRDIYLAGQSLKDKE